MSVRRFVLLAFALLFFPLTVNHNVWADSSNSPEEYSIGQDADAPAPDNGAPVRMAYFSFVSGDVQWRINPDAVDAQAFVEDAPASPAGDKTPDAYDWDSASTNLPLRSGMEVRVAPGAKAELCFDDGSQVRLAGNSHLFLDSLTSDNDGETTTLRLEGGLISLKLKNTNSLFEVRSGNNAVRARGLAALRIGAGTGENGEMMEIAVRSGKAAIENDSGRITLRSGQFLKLRGGEDQFAPRNLPPADSWDNWNLSRDDFWEAGSEPEEGAKGALPENLALVSGNLERHGLWRDDADYGRVWYPSNQSSDWRPYHNGRWSWFFPFGWTWVSYEAWGWAPYHYGTWARCPYGWAWVPGPAYQPWCPGVVNFYDRDGAQCWAPLSPREVRYPTYTSRPRWSFSFSIGDTACYVPTSNIYCEPRRWNSGYVNYVTNITYITYVTHVKKVKKIEYKCPGEHRPRYCVDGAPDDHFGRIFPRNGNNWDRDRDGNGRWDGNRDGRSNNASAGPRGDDNKPSGPGNFHPRYAMNGGATVAQPAAFDPGKFDKKDDTFTGWSHNNNGGNGNRPNKDGDGKPGTGNNSQAINGTGKTTSDGKSKADGDAKQNGTQTSSGNLADIPWFKQNNRSSDGRGEGDKSRDKDNSSGVKAPEKNGNDRQQTPAVTSGPMTYTDQLKIWQDKTRHDLEAKQGKQQDQDGERKNKDQTGKVSSGNWQGQSYDQWRAAMDRKADAERQAEAQRKQSGDGQDKPKQDGFKQDSDRQNKDQQAADQIRQAQMNAAQQIQDNLRRQREQQEKQRADQDNRDRQEKAAREAQRQQDEQNRQAQEQKAAQERAQREQADRDRAENEKRQKNNNDSSSGGNGNGNGNGDRGGKGKRH